MEKTKLFRGIIRPILLLTAVLPFPLLADIFAPSHSCSKPFKPFEFSSEFELDMFNSDVEDYKYCISEFVDEQQEQAQDHLDAAAEAIDEWNNFVSYELNF